MKLIFKFNDARWVDIPFKQIKSDVNKLKYSNNINSKLNNGEIY